MEQKFDDFIDELKSMIQAVTHDGPFGLRIVNDMSQRERDSIVRDVESMVDQYHDESY